jgi:hypothetical protein
MHMAYMWHWWQYTKLMSSALLVAGLSDSIGWRQVSTALASIKRKKKKNCELAVSGWYHLLVVAADLLKVGGVLHV